MKSDKKWHYDVKCRKCGKITRMFHSSFEQISPSQFVNWAVSHSTFPIQCVCDCDPEMIGFHDLVGFVNYFLKDDKSLEK